MLLQAEAWRPAGAVAALPSLETAYPHHPIAHGHEPRTQNWLDGNKRHDMLLFVGSVEICQPMDRRALRGHPTKQD